MSRRSAAAVAALGAVLVAYAQLVGPWREPEGAPRPNILLITIDTLRADAIGAYGAPAGQTPRIDGLDRRSTRYTRAFAPIPLTRPAHLALFTGRHPRDLGALTNRAALPSDAPLLTDSLHAGGYTTAAFVGTRLLGPEAGLARGFGRYVSPQRKQVPAAWVVERAVTWLRQEARQPFFVWVHLFDPHQPYGTGDDSGAAAAGAGEHSRYGGITWQSLDAAAAAHGGAVPADVLAQARAAYASDVHRADDAVGALLQEVAEGHFAAPWVVLTADHGECFEHGIYFEHADCMFQGALRVPLLVHSPEDPRQRVRDEPVDLLDIAPTILAIAGVGVGRPAEGRSLLGDLGRRRVLAQYPWFDAGTSAYRVRTIRSVGGEAVAPHHAGVDGAAVVDGTWKYVLLGEDGRFFDVSDPGADRAVGEAHVPSGVAASLRADAAAFLSRRPPARPVAGNADAEELLRALGYAQ